MKLFFEQYPYSPEDVKDILDKDLYTDYNGSKVIPYVGYYYAPNIKNEDGHIVGDSVFILPKVFITQGKLEGEERTRDLAFGRYKPEDIIDVDTKEVLEKKDNEIIFGLSTWLYKAIAHFVERHQNTGISREAYIQNVVSFRGEEDQTYLDTILSLLRFHKEHKNLFTYITILNSSGRSTINWDKTINKSVAIIKRGIPFYPETIAKDKAVNYDEDLIVLFYSVLNYLKNKYQFRVDRKIEYKLIKPNKIQQLIDSGKGLRILKDIRKKYFTDELVALWHLLRVFFDKAHRVATKKYTEERLLVRSFNIVFEDMIDYLISDNRNNLPKELYNQQDGKLVDHIYKGTSLLDDNNDIYYIGDSKYYKDTTDYSNNSIYKQFTYAKNIIQYNINVFNNKGNVGKFRYRDPLTEGYDITPNFFIRGEVDFEKLNNQDSNIKEIKLEFTNKHFFNRLFDRDTLFLQSYSINFLYLLNIYSTNVESSVKTSLRNRIRKDFISFLESKFDFYLLEPLYDIHDAIEKNFRRLNGKMYKPSSSGNLLVMALEKNYVLDNLILLSEIEPDFKVHEYHLDEQEYKTITSFSYWCPTFNPAAEEEVSYGSNKSYSAKYEIIDSNSVLLGVYKNEDHKNWILEKKKYNVRLGNRVGAVKQNRQVLFAKYLVLYNINDETEFDIYELADNHNIMTGEQMSSEGYPFDKDFKDKKYFLYSLLERSDKLKIDNLSSILESKRTEFFNSTKEELVKGSPIYVYQCEMKG